MLTFRFWFVYGPLKKRREKREHTNFFVLHSSAFHRSLSRSLQRRLRKRLTTSPVRTRKEWLKNKTAAGLLVESVARPYHQHSIKDDCAGKRVLVSTERESGRERKTTKQEIKWWKRDRKYYGSLVLAAIFLLGSPLIKKEEEEEEEEKISHASASRSIKGQKGNREESPGKHGLDDMEMTK